MQLTKISRSKSFEMVNGYGLKSWTKFAIEGDLAEQESPLEAYSELGKIIDEAFKQEYPKSVEPPKEIQVSKPTPESNMITAITTCTTPDVLKTFEKLAKSNSKFQEAYDSRMEFLFDATYDILDKNGIEMHVHYSGRDRSYIEAKKMLDSLNQHGEYSPYTLKLINQ